MKQLQNLTSKDDISIFLCHTHLLLQWYTTSHIKGTSTNWVPDWKKIEMVCIYLCSFQLQNNNVPYPHWESSWWFWRNPTCHVTWFFIHIFLLLIYLLPKASKGQQAPKSYITSSIRVRVWVSNSWQGVGLSLSFLICNIFLIGWQTMSPGTFHIPCQRSEAMRGNHRKGINNATVWNGHWAFGWHWCSVCICIF